MSNGDFDLTSASTYKEALMLVNHSLELQGKDMTAIKEAIEEVKSQQRETCNDQMEFREVLADFIKEYTTNHADHETKIKSNSKDIETLKEKTVEIKKWNVADTANLLITAVVAFLNKFFASQP